MSTIDVFWNYLHQFYPTLENEDWFVDIKLIQKDTIVNQQIKAHIPASILKVKCWFFYYKINSPTSVYLLQEENGTLHISIGLINNNNVQHSICLWEDTV